MVMCHSPSHFNAGIKSDSGWLAFSIRNGSRVGTPVTAATSSFDNASFIVPMAYTGLSTTPATSPIT